MKSFLDIFQVKSRSYQKIMLKYTKLEDPITISDPESYIQDIDDLTKALEDDFEEASISFLNKYR